MATHSKRFQAVGLVAVVTVLLAGVARAHHDTTAFDRGNPIVVSGVVHEFRWTSPHAWIVVDVPSTRQSAAPRPVAKSAATPAVAAPAAEAEQWAFEGASIAVMVRNGWKSSSLRAGDHVSVEAAPRRDGTRSGEFRRVTLTDSGKVLQIAGP